MGNPIKRFVCGGAVGGDALALLLVLLGCVEEGGVYDDGVSVALLDEHGMAARLLRLDGERLRLAVEELKRTGEIEIFNDGRTEVLTVVRWGEFRKDMMREGRRLYQRDRSEARRIMAQL